MRTWASDAGVSPASMTLDRDAGEGPARCCARRFVAADALVFYGDLDSGKLARVRARFPDLSGATYLCDSCRETLRREKVIARTEMPTSRALSNPNVEL